MSVPSDAKRRMRRKQVLLAASAVARADAAAAVDSIGERVDAVSVRIERVGVVLRSVRELRASGVLGVITGLLVLRRWGLVQPLHIALLGWRVWRHLAR